jgi:hypothetical protein
MIKIIGISGFIGSGKDTVADYLVNYYGFRRESFANTLKDAVACVFGWDRLMLEGRTAASRAWREQVDTWWARRLEIPNLTPRWILQYWGTNLCRHGFHNDIWVASLENQIRQSTDNIVIPDVRFPNEIDAIRGVGGKIICVERGSPPEWLSCALQTVSTHEDDRWIMSDQQRDMASCYPNIHPSEWSWLGTNFDQVIDNNGTVDQLYSQIKNLVEDHRDASMI